MDRYDPSRFDLFRGLRGLNSAAISGAYDPMMWKAMRLAEHQYLLDQTAQMSRMGIDSTISSALKEVPATGVVMPQVSQWAQDLSSIAEQVGSIFSKVKQFVEIVGDRMATIATPPATLFDGIRASETVSGLNTMIGALPKVQDFNRFWDAITPAVEEFRELMEDPATGMRCLRRPSSGLPTTCGTSSTFAASHIYPQR